MDTAGATASPTGSVSVGANTDAPLAAVGMTFQPTEQSTFSGIVATFTDADPAGSAGDYIAQITWGDGFVSTATISADPAFPGQFDISGSVTYTTTGTLPVRVAVSDKGGATVVVESLAAVTVLPLANGATFQAQATVPLSVQVATISDVNPGDQPTDFTATIDWGMGTVLAAWLPMIRRPLPVSAYWAALSMRIQERMPSWSRWYVETALT